MKTIIALILVIILYALNESSVVQSFIARKTLATKMVPFADVKERKQYINVSITVESKTIHYCALACGKDPSCFSFNFCGRDKCELNDGDIFSTKNGEQSLKNNEACKYVGMAKLDQPKCKELGETIDIQEDTHRGVCAINGKRVDSQWAQWAVDDPEIDTSTVWKQFEKRYFLLDPAHGGKTVGPSQRVFSWIRWVDQPMTWSEAETNCAQLGGKLFFNLDGTKKQLDFFLDKLRQKSHWLGIYTTDHTSWVTVNGSTIADSRLNWDPVQDFDSTKQGQTHVPNYIGGNYRYLNDRFQKEKHLSVCDLKQ